MVVKPNSKQEKPEMTELAAQIVALGCGVLTLSPSAKADFAIGFDVDEDSPKIRYVFWEQHFNGNHKDPWDKWVSKRERSFATVEEGLSQYRVNGKLLKDCVENVEPIIPM